MAQRFWGLMPIERAAAWVFYDPKSDATSVILRMKYNNHPEYGEILGSLAAREFQPYHFFDSIDALIPIPLAPNRFKQRGFNQSLEIARGVQKVTQLPILNNVIKRTVVKSSYTAVISHYDLAHSRTICKKLFKVYGKKTVYTV